MGDDKPLDRSAGSASSEGAPDAPRGEARAEVAGHHPPAGPGWMALAAGVLVPGLGHALGRRRWWKGAFFFGATCFPVTTLLPALQRVLDDYDFLLSLVEAPERPLSVLLLVLSASLVIHIWSLIDLCGLSVRLSLRGLLRPALAATATTALYAPVAAFLIYLASDLQHSAALAEMVATTPLQTPVVEVLVAVTPTPAASVNSSPRPQDQPAPVAWPVWTGTERVTILLLGLDTRPDERQRGIIGNTDAILLLSLDPVTRRALLVSLPRDLWVPIPRRGQGKINAVFALGGPELLKQTVATLTGLPVHYYVAVRFDGFTQIVDAFGGVLLDVPRPVKDNQYPTEDYRVERIFIPAGMQWMPGSTALQYVRSRHDSSDFERARRQQQVLFALRARLAEPQTALRLLQMAPDLATLVETDVSLRDGILLAGLVRQIEPHEVTALVLAPPEFGREINSPSLYSIVPDQAAIRQRLAELLATPPG